MQYDTATRSWEKIAPVFGTMAQGVEAIGAGGFRDAYPASVTCQALDWQDRAMVAKHFHTEGKDKVTQNFRELDPEAAIREETRVSVQINETVMGIAQKFNVLVPCSPVVYNKVYLVTEKISGKSFVLEDFVEGKAWKVLMNSGRVDEASPPPEDRRLADVAVAFAHFSLASTEEALIVLDVQGVGGTFLDPAICTNKSLDPNEERGDSANLFATAIDTFKVYHRCNSICSAAGLSPFDNS